MHYRDRDTGKMAKGMAAVRRRGFHKKDRFARLKHPGELYREFKAATPKAGRPARWKRHNASWRKRRRLNKIARASRKRNRPQ